MASSFFQLAFWDFQGFLVGLCDFCRFFSSIFGKFFSSGIFSWHFGPLQVFKLVFRVLSGF